MRPLAFVTMRLMLVLLSIGAERIVAQPTPMQACDFLDVATANRILGFHVALKSSQETDCVMRSDDKSQFVKVGINTFPEKTAATMLKFNFGGARDRIASGGVSVGVYNYFTPWPGAGENAYYLSTKDSTTNSDLVFYQFRIKENIIALETKGISPEAIAPKLNELYAAVQASVSKH